MSTSNDFFANAPANYAVPKSEGKYMKFKAPGKYKFRILEKPIFGFEAWKAVDGKDVPVRFKMDEKPADLSTFRNGQLNHFWAMPVWNFNTGHVEILSFNQKGIQSDIEAYARNEDWGSPLTYNLTVTREGTTKEDTKYSTVASPHNELPEEAKASWAEVQANGFNIAELFVDGDPFKPSTPAPAATAAQAAPAAQQAPVATSAPSAPENTAEASTGPLEDTEEPND